ncbi:uncharacterized protein LOC143137436 isoform X1 [Alosa pseudoharengus]|uniref:uncharacterized protein LOC143137436 isoform X1 n=1 Tax=Alosa pseudoharengus TaxID=34774 RepID=UPI003F8C0485
MEVLGLLVGGTTVLLSVILLTSLCLNCMRSSPSHSIITENHDNDDYTQPSGSFMVTRSGTEAYPTRDNFHTLSPRLNPAPYVSQSPSPVTRPICSTNTDDDQSSADEYVNTEEEDDRAYIHVLPPEVGANASATQSKLSLCPSHSSQGQDSNEYINVDPQHTKDNPTHEGLNDESDRNSEDYQNVSPVPVRCISTEFQHNMSGTDSEPEPQTFLIGSQASLDSDDDLDSGAYVNV